MKNLRTNKAIDYLVDYMNLSTSKNSSIGDYYIERQEFLAANSARIANPFCIEKEERMNLSSKELRI